MARSSAARGRELELHDRVLICGGLHKNEAGELVAEPGKFFNGWAVRLDLGGSIVGVAVDKLMHLRRDGELSAATTEPRTITVWVCDECDYWRQDRSSGVHQTFVELSFEEQKRTGRRNAVHTLREAVFAEVRDA